MVVILFGGGLFRDQTENAMKDASDETVKELDIRKVEVSGQIDSWDTIPETIQELLSNLPLLDHEDEQQFLNCSKASEPMHSPKTSSTITSSTMRRSSNGRRTAIAVWPWP